MGNVQGLGEKDLELVIAASEAEDIRTVLRERKVHRKQVAKAAYAAQEAGIITGEEFSAIAGKIERPKSFPSDPEQRLEAVLAGFMNAEPKQILTMLLNPGITEVGSLARQFDQVAGESWKRGTAKILDRYLVNSLDNIGFIAHPVVIRQPLSDAGIGHALTEAGTRYQPLAAFALGVANKTGLSLQQILGPTNTNGDSRSPYNRFRILEELLKGNCRIGDLALTLNLAPSSVAGHLKALKKTGFVKYDSVGPENRGWAIRGWVNGVPSDAQPIGTLRTLTKQVAGYLFEQGPADYNAVFEYLSSLPMYEKIGKKGMRENIISVISGLVKQGFVESHTDYKSAIRSHVSLTREGEEFAEDFTGRIRSAVSGGAELEAMRGVYNGYRSDFGLFSQHAAHGMELYLPVSQSGKITPSEVTDANVIDYLLEAGKARHRKLIEAFGKAANVSLKRLLAAGILEKTRGPGSAVFYELAKTAPASAALA